MSSLKSGTLLAVVALVAACSGSSSSSAPSVAIATAGPSASAPATLAPSVTAKPTAAPLPTRFPVPTDIATDGTCHDNGPCLGVLSAGTHRTEHFEQGFTFTVPAGWENLEETGGSFDLEKLDAPGDAILFYGLPRPTKSDGSPMPGTFDTPAAIAAALATDDQLALTTPTSVKVGGLSGVVVNVTAAPSATEHDTQCPVVACVMMLHGEDAAPTWQWDLGVGSGEQIRLYLLKTKGDVLAIAVDSLVGTSFDALTTAAKPILESVKFGGM